MQIECGQASSSSSKLVKYGEQSVISQAIYLIGHILYNQCLASQSGVTSFDTLKEEENSWFFVEFL